MCSINLIFLRPFNRFVNQFDKSFVSFYSCRKFYSTSCFAQASFKTVFGGKGKLSKPTSSLVLSTHLRQRGLPHWTSYFVKYSDIISDQRGLSHFNWLVDGENYHVLRTGCWPYIKYHCTKRPHEDLQFEDTTFRIIKTINIGIPCLAYGAAATFLISCEEEIRTPQGVVKIYFLYLEDKGARH